MTILRSSRRESLVVLVEVVAPPARPGGVPTGEHGNKLAERLVSRDSWRHLVLARIEELQCDLDGSGRESLHAANVRELIRVAHDAVYHVPLDLGWFRRQVDAGVRWWNGTCRERAFGALHLAEAEAVFLMSDSRLAARLPMYVAYGEQQLTATDARVVSVRSLLHAPRLAVRHDDDGRLCRVHRFGPDQRSKISQLVHDSYAAVDEAYAASRTYRNRLIRLSLIAAGVTAAVVVAAGVAGWALDPPNVPVVTSDGEIETAQWVGGEGQAPAGAGPFAVIAVMGAVGAFLSGINSVVRTKGSRNPFSLPLYQMLVKLCVGGLSAIVGVAFLQVGFVPGVPPAVTMSSVLVWAVGFGAAQQAITRLVDRRVADLVSPTDDPETTSEVTSVAVAAPGFVEVSRSSVRADSLPPVGGTRRTRRALER
jgi:hypothetical protein